MRAWRRPNIGGIGVEIAGALSLSTDPAVLFSHRRVSGEPLRAVGIPTIRIPDVAAAQFVD